MSRIGKNPIVIPEGVEVKVEGNKVTCTGKLGTLTEEFLNSVEIKVEDSKVIVTRKSDEFKNVHGLTRSLINNMVIGVSKGFEKSLEINGVGYRVAKKGNKLDLTLGFSHPVEVEDTEDVKTEVKGNVITVKGINKQKVGQFAAEIRGIKPPEPYKGKGIKYTDERIRRKEGKTGAK